MSIANPSMITAISIRSTFLTGLEVSWTRSQILELSSQLKTSELNSWQLLAFKSLILGQISLRVFQRWILWSVTLHCVSDNISFLSNNTEGLPIIKLRPHFQKLPSVSAHQPKPKVQRFHWCSRNISIRLNIFTAKPKLQRFYWYLRDISVLLNISTAKAKGTKMAF